jgi:hypothetical protein
MHQDEIAVGRRELIAQVDDRDHFPTSTRTPHEHHVTVSRRDVDDTPIHFVVAEGSVVIEHELVLSRLDDLREESAHIPRRPHAIDGQPQVVLPGGGRPRSTGAIPLSQIPNPLVSSHRRPRNEPTRDQASAQRSSMHRLSEPR